MSGNPTLESGKSRWAASRSMLLPIAAVAVVVGAVATVAGGVVPLSPLALGGYALLLPAAVYIDRIARRPIGWPLRLALCLHAAVFLLLAYNTAASGFAARHVLGLRLASVLLAAAIMVAVVGLAVAALASRRWGAIGTVVAALLAVAWLLASNGSSSFKAVGVGLYLAVAGLTLVSWRRFA